MLPYLYNALNDYKTFQVFAVINMPKYGVGLWNCLGQLLSIKTRFDGIFRHEQRNFFFYRYISCRLGGCVCVFDGVHKLVINMHKYLVVCKKD